MIKKHNYTVFFYSKSIEDLFTVYSGSKCSKFMKLKKYDIDNCKYRLEINCYTYFPILIKPLRKIFVKIINVLYQTNIY